MQSGIPEQTQKQKTPISHKWAVFVFVMFLAVNIMLAARGAFDPVTGLIIFLCLASLIGLFAFARSQRTYWIAALTLALVVLRGGYYGVLQPAYLLLTHNPSVREDWSAIAFQMFGVGLLVWLLLAYAIGRASRSFYGFSLTPSIPAA